ncbi:hypothetical protein BDQ17DRAFT_1441187 [Cyathus striatus]|nr:hypothetical protein BDQ17DRAFT_1441187 [Cyathus striatus]
MTVPHHPAHSSPLSFGHPPFPPHQCHITCPSLPSSFCVTSASTICHLGPQPPSPNAHITTVTAPGTAPNPHSDDYDTSTSALCAISLLSLAPRLASDEVPFPLLPLFPPSSPASSSRKR